MGLTKKQCEALGLGHLFPTATGPGLARGEAKPKPKSESDLPQGLGLKLLPPAQAGGPRSWTIEIPGWTPPSLNSLLYAHWTTARRTKQKAMATVAACCLETRVTRATGRRRVAITVTVKQSSHMLDADNVPKSILDGLTHVGALVDDRSEWCELVAPRVTVGPQKKTVIVLEEIGEVPC